jgi:hypothetical protein
MSCKLATLIQAQKHSIFFANQGLSLPPLAADSYRGLYSKVLQCEVVALYDQGQISDKRERPKITPQTQMFSYGPKIFVSHIQPKHFRFLWFMPSLSLAHVNFSPTWQRKRLKTFPAEVISSLITRIALILVPNFFNHR